MKDYLILNIFIQVSKIASVNDVKISVIEAFDKIEREDISEDLLTGIKENQAIRLQSDRLSNDFRISHLSELFLAGWNSNSLESRYNYRNAITKEDLSKFVSGHIKDNITLVETFHGTRSLPKVTKPNIRKLVFSEIKKSDFANKFSTNTEFDIKPVFADFKNLISFKSYENGNQFIYQKNKRNSLFKLKLIIENGAWLSPYLSLSVDYWRHLGTDLYSPSALSSKFFTFGTTVQIVTRGDHLEIEMEGDDKNFASSIRLLEHSIRSVSPSKAIWDSQIVNAKESLNERSSDSAEMDYALRDFALFEKSSLRFFNASAVDLNNITSSSAVDILENLLNYKCTLIYYGSLSFDELEENIMQSYFSAKGLKDTSKLRKVVWNQKSMPNVYFLNRLLPHSEIKLFAPSLSNAEISNGKIALFNAMSTSMTSPFFLEMRERSGYSYSAYHYLMRSTIRKDPIIWNVTFACQSDKISECIETAKKSLANTKPIEENFEFAKAATLKQLGMVRKDEVDVTDDYLDSLRLGYSDDPEKIAYEELLTLQADEYIVAINKLIQNSVFNATVVADRNRIKPSDLRELGQFRELKPEQVLSH